MPLSCEAGRIVHGIGRALASPWSTPHFPAALSLGAGGSYGRVVCPVGWNDLSAALRLGAGGAVRAGETSSSSKELMGGPVRRH